MVQKAFTRDNHATAIAVAYRNPETSLIAERVLPYVNVALQEFSYWEYPLAEGYSVPSTKVGEHDRINTATVKGERKTARCEGRGIGIPLTKRDLEQSANGSQARDRATERATNIVLLDFEVEVAQLVTDPANYPAGLKKDLSVGGNKYLDDDEGDPLGELLDALEAPLIRPNVVEIGARAWRKIRTNPILVSAALGNSGQSGIVTPERLAELLEVSEVLIGSSRLNVVKPGKEPVLQRVWGNQVLAFYRDTTVDTSGGVTFGFTAREEPGRQAGTVELDIGTRGGTEMRVTEDRKSLIVAPHAAFLITNATSPDQ